MASHFYWHPASYLQDQASEFALLVLNQPLEDNCHLRRLWRNSSFRIAADGGANRLHELGDQYSQLTNKSNLDVIIGDLDSLHPPVRKFYSSQLSPALIVHDASQESTDFGKAVAHIRQTRPRGTDIVVLGGLGGRVDQGLSQLHHLYLVQPGADYAGGRVYLVSSESVTVLLKPGVHRIRVRGGEESHSEGRQEGHEEAPSDEEEVFGKHVGIIPLGQPARISTRGLEWDVTDWETSIGGRLSTSNHVLPQTRVVEVHTSHSVLFTIALRGEA